MGRMKVLLALVAISPVALDVAAGQTNAGDNAAADIVATQVRDQGYQCDEPTSATEDQEPEGDAVWTLKCANATYRVRLVPDMAAAIERID
jgi:hypothetical protein